MALWRRWGLGEKSGRRVGFSYLFNQPSEANLSTTITTSFTSNLISPHERQHLRSNVVVIAICNPSKVDGVCKSIGSLNGISVPLVIAFLALVDDTSVSNTTNLVSLLKIFMRRLEEDKSVTYSLILSSNISSSGPKKSIIAWYVDTRPSTSRSSLVLFIDTFLHNHSSLLFSLD